MVKKYESIKGSYERDQDYLAAITVNGIWIREKSTKKNNIIRASNLQGNNLINLTIYEFDSNQDFVKRIDAKSADISALRWKIKDAKIIDKNGETILENIKNIFNIIREYFSVFVHYFYLI